MVQVSLFVPCAQWAIQCCPVSQTPMAQQHFRESKGQQHCSEVTGFIEEIYGQKDVEGAALTHTVHLNKSTVNYILTFT